MNRKKLAVAVEEAKRFLARAEALPLPQPYTVHGQQFVNNHFPKDQGAIKRASMDLTRALADLRRPN